MIAYFILLIISVIPFWIIHYKAGQNPLYAVIVMIPLIGLLISLSILAFAPWNIEATLNKYDDSSGDLADATKNSDSGDYPDG